MLLRKNFYSERLKFPSECGFKVLLLRTVQVRETDDIEMHLNKMNSIGMPVTGRDEYSQ